MFVSQITIRTCSYFSHDSNLRLSRVNLVSFFMVPIIRLEPNGCQALISHDDAIEDLKIHIWDVFLKIFEGYNLQVAKAFTQTFDGCIEKIGDIWLEVIEEFVSEAIEFHLLARNGSKTQRLKNFHGTSS